VCTAAAAVGSSPVLVALSQRRPHGAELHDGVLIITLPKARAPKPARLRCLNAHDPIRGALPALRREPAKTNRSKKMTRAYQKPSRPGGRTTRSGCLPANATSAKDANVVVADIPSAKTRST
jgi:hypothetical protein